MNAVLNGTCWGELPNKELNAPEWMSGSYYDTSDWEEYYNVACINKAIGRERRKVRISAYHRHNRFILTVGFIAVIALLMTVGTLCG